MISYKPNFFKTLWFSLSRFQTRQMSKIPKLYGDEVSPPVRFVMITAKFLGVHIHFHQIDMFKGENKSEFYTKINPLQKVPAITIDEQTIRDSHAIALYLCGRTDSQDLYPIDNIARARVDEMLYFNATTLFPIDSFIYTQYFSGKWPIDKTKVTEWYSAIDYLEIILNKNHWLAGNKLQLCDICCGMTVLTLNILLPSLKKHVKVKEWMNNLEALSCFDINKRGLERLKYYMKIYGPVEHKI